MSVTYYHCWRNLIALKSGSYQYEEDTDPEIKIEQKDNDSVQNHPETQPRNLHMLILNKM